MKATFLFAKTQLLRVLRDPITLVVLFAIPVLLMVLFGTFTKGTSDISLKVAVINNSNEQFAKDFERKLHEVKTFEISDKTPSLDEAKKQMRGDELDGIVELPAGFGAATNGLPTGKAKVYFDQSDVTTSDIVNNVMNAVVSQANQKLTGASLPLSVERTSISGNNTRIFDGLFAVFAAIAVMIVGIFGVTTTIASDKKTGILRRLHVTPLRSSQLVMGTMLAFAGIGVLAVILMTLLALTAFGLQMKGDWPTFGGFSLLAIVLMLGFGLAVGGWAKNATQADIYGQVVFMISLAFSGLWFPRALMPDWLQGITTFLPLTPVIEGFKQIVTEAATFATLGFELTIIVVWLLIVFTIGIKTFRWE